MHYVPSIGTVECVLCRRILHLADLICGGWATPGATGLARVLWSKSASCGKIICTAGQVCALWAIWGVQVIFVGFDRDGVM